MHLTTHPELDHTALDRAALQNETTFSSSDSKPHGLAETACLAVLDCCEAPTTSVLGVEARPIAVPMRGKSLQEILDHVKSLRPAIQIPKETLEMAEEIVSGADAPGIETSSLLQILRVAIFLDRQTRIG